MFIVRIIENGMTCDSRYANRVDAERVHADAIAHIGQFPYLEDAQLFHIKPNGEITRIDTDH